MRQKIDAGSALATIGAALLLVSLFVRWWSPGGTAWQVFETLDLLLVAIAVLVAAATLGPLAAPGGRAPAWAFWLALASLGVVGVELVDPPPAARGSDLATGAWMGLAATALMAAGTLLSRSSIHVTVDVRERDRRRRVAAVDHRGRAGAAAVRTPQPAHAPPEAETRVASASGAVEDDGDRTQPMSALPDADEERA
jgi:hypothetical protein